MSNKIMTRKHENVQLEYTLPIIGAFVPFGGDIVDIHKTIIDDNGVTLYLSLNPISLNRILEMTIEGRVVSPRKWMYASDAIIKEVEYGVGIAIKYRHGPLVKGSLWLT